MSETSAQDVARRGIGEGHPWKIYIVKAPTNDYDAHFARPKADKASKIVTSCPNSRYNGRLSP